MSAVTVTGAKTSPATVSFVLGDAESNPTSVDIRFFPARGSAADAERVRLRNAPSLEGLATSPEGELHAFEWDYAPDPAQVAEESLGLTLFVTVDGGAQEPILDVNAVQVDVGNKPPVVHAVDPIPTDPLQPDESEGNVEIRLRVSDSASDPVDIAVEWRRASDPPDAWNPATAAGVSPGGLETEPEPGVEYSFFWNTNVDLADEEAEVFKGVPDLTVFFQRGAGRFDAVPLRLGGPGITERPGSLAVVDLDGDGEVDLVSGNDPDANMTIFWGGR